jgi:hypothetical protein
MDNNLNAHNLSLSLLFKTIKLFPTKIFLKPKDKSVIVFCLLTKNKIFFRNVAQKPTNYCRQFLKTIISWENVLLTELFFQPPLFLRQKNSFLSLGYENSMILPYFILPFVIRNYYAWSINWFGLVIVLVGYWAKTVHSEILTRGP